MNAQTAQTADALAVACPRCEAAQGAPCTTASGKVARAPHAPRLAAAEPMTLDALADLADRADRGHSDARETLAALREVGEVRLGGALCGTCDSRPALAVWVADGRADACCARCASQHSFGADLAVTDAPADAPADAEAAQDAPADDYGIPTDAAFTEAFTRLATEATVCEVCGLERMGHAPEAAWLDVDPHDYAGRPASSEDIRKARDLTGKAYAAQRLAREATQGAPADAEAAQDAPRVLAPAEGEVWGALDLADLADREASREDAGVVRVADLAAALEPESYRADGTQVHYAYGWTTAEAFDLGRFAMVSDPYGDADRYTLALARDWQTEQPDAPWTTVGGALALDMWQDADREVMAVVPVALAGVLGEAWDADYMPEPSGDALSAVTDALEGEQYGSWVAHDLELGEDAPTVAREVWDLLAPDERGEVAREVSLRTENYGDWEGTSLSWERGEFARLGRDVAAHLARLSLADLADLAGVDAPWLAAHLADAEREAADAQGEA